ncbi:hypothetical protein Mapa_002980 [Marchantia paleacea]|nr:hypothetical protein Mapa_002980 [Marchantia paleacea]
MQRKGCSATADVDGTGISHQEFRSISIYCSAILDRQVERKVQAGEESCAEALDSASSGDCPDTSSASPRPTHGTMPCTSYVCCASSDGEMRIVQSNSYPQ